MAITQLSFIILQALTIKVGRKFTLSMTTAQCRWKLKTQNHLVTSYAKLCNSLIKVYHKSSHKGVDHVVK